MNTDGETSCQLLFQNLCKNRLNLVAADVRRLTLKNQKSIKASSRRLLLLRTGTFEHTSNSSASAGERYNDSTAFSSRPSKVAGAQNGSTSRVVLTARYCRINGASARLLP